MPIIPSAAAVDIWQRARDLRMLANRWRHGDPLDKVALVVDLIHATGPGWHCLGTIAPVWRGLIDEHSDVCLWWLLHRPTDAPCLRCIQLNWLPELMRPAAAGETWCDYHLGGRLPEDAVDAEGGITVTRYAGAGA